MDIRTRIYMTQVRTILKMRVNLLEKDLGADKKDIVIKLIDELSLEQLNKIRNVNDNIADNILKAFSSSNKI